MKKNMAADIAAAGGYFHEEAENQVLSLMLSDRGIAKEIAQSGVIGLENGEKVSVSPDFFFTPAKGLIFDAICELSQADVPYSDQQIASRCLSLAVRQKRTREAGGLTADTIRSIRNTRFDSGSPKALEQMYARRQVLEITTFLSMANKPDSDPADVWAQLEDMMRSKRPKAKEDRVVYGHDALERHLATLNERKRKFDSGIQTGLTTPWPSWNAAMIPHVAGKYFSVIMPQNHGKTIWLTNWSEYLAKIGMKVVYVHIEDTFDSLMDRQLCRWSLIPLGKLRSGNLSEDDEKKKAAGRERISAFADGINYLNCAGYTMSQIISQLVLLKRDNQCDAVFIDYLEGITPESQSRNSSYREQGKDPRMLVDFSNLHGVPVVVGDQISKEAEEEAQKTGVLKLTSQRGFMDKVYSAAYVFGGYRRKAGENSLFDDGFEVAKPHELSCVANFSTLKANDFFHSTFKLCVHGSTYSVYERDRYYEILKREMQINEIPA